MTLRGKVYLLNTLLLCITVLGAVLMVWYTFKIETIFKEIVNRNVEIFQSAEALGTSLVNQKGFVSYYILDNNPDWIVQLNRYRDRFNTHLASVATLVSEPWEQEKMLQISDKYHLYSSKRDRVIAFYSSGERDRGASLHQEVRSLFFDILDLCEAFKTFHKKKIEVAMENSSKESRHLRYIALMGVVSVISLSLLVNFIFVRHILEPIRKLAVQVESLESRHHSSLEMKHPMGFEDSKDPGRNAVLKKGGHADEVALLKQSVMGLIQDATLTHQALERSRESLMQSEKMALVGKLAAGTAHSIRNPLTSVNMRLFSLQRSTDLSLAQQEDLSVIAGEILQVNKIVENFLEFSRPPKLMMKSVSPSTVVDRAVALLSQRLKSYRVNASVIRKVPLSDTMVDPEQLKEVIVNIMINACEAMRDGGTIIIEEKEHFAAEHERSDIKFDGKMGPDDRLDIICITDNGEGIPSALKERIFDPFFTTKDEGTGLGLSIAFNIINEHGGWLDLVSEEGKGSSFIITLPVRS